MDIIIHTCSSKLVSIQAIRQLTGASLKNATDLIELAEKDYTVGICDVPKEQSKEVLQMLYSAGISAEASEKKVAMFRKMPFSPAEQIIPLEQPIQSNTPYRAPSTNVRKKTDGSLKGYLKTVAALECQLWNQDRLINSLNRKTSYLGKSKELKKPNKRNYYQSEFWVLSIIPAIAAFFAADFGFVIRLVSLAVTWLLSVFILNFVQNAGAASAYQEAMNQYDKSVAADQKRVRQELKLKQDILQQIESVKSERQRTRNALNSLYALSIIHPNYRNLVAVCSFYDYLDKGICSRLEGRDGAYAFYEEDLRFKRLEAKLDVIIAKLDEIASNQQYLASLIRDGNATLSRIEQQNNKMLKQMDSIQENTAVTAYNTKCCEESMSVMESISIYHFLKH